MKRLLTLTISCLWLISIYGQTSEIPDGIYEFQEAELIIRHYDTKEIITHKAITDTASIAVWALHQDNLLLEVEIRDGEIVECILPDRHRYGVESGANLQLPSSEREKLTRAEIERDGLYRYIDTNLRPFELRVEGDKLIVSFDKYNFGQSNIDYTMVAELTVTLTKQKYDETKNI